MAQGELFPKEPGWEYGSVLPLAQRPIPYAGALAPELALPDIVRSPVNELTKALTLPQRTMLGQATPDAESAANFALALTGAGGLMTRAQPNSLGAMMGWHGTPHRFEPVEHNPFGEFRDSNIGTGEGAQVYGWGHYVAGAKKVAEDYKKKLSQDEEGSLYQVQIKPDEHELLDWDKPLNKQPLGIQAKLNESRLVPKLTITDDQIIKAQEAGQYGTAGFLEAQRTFLENRWKMTGGDWYNTYAGDVGKATASNALHEAGIPGIKYLDQGSRGFRLVSPTTKGHDWTVLNSSNQIAAKGSESQMQDFMNKTQTSNYVIFHPKNLKITGRNGEELPVELVTSDVFKELGNAQRGHPEQAMTKVQFANGGGVLNPVVEHIGDLTNRMSFDAPHGYFGYDTVKEKVQRGLRYLKSEYGFEKEMEGNFKNNAEAKGMSIDEFKKSVHTALQTYADAHKKLPVYNKAQELGRDAAVAIGERRWKDAEKALEALNTRLGTREDWDKFASAGLDKKSNLEPVEYDPFQLPISSEAQRLNKAMDWREELENIQLGLGPFSPGPMQRKTPGANR